ncbi:MAG: ATP-binding cassette domain-containing protein, partial [Oxalobacteraceae bacterium]|nr:ATP-binding cassette domain-containing protein [Oxalobacteraceae bacterium]
MTNARSWKNRARPENHANRGNDLTLRVSSICKSFGARKALDNVSLQVGAGEFLALLGPNGAGKTTL